MSFLNSHFFKYTRENPGKVFYKASISDDDQSFRIWDISKKKKLDVPSTIKLEKLHENEYPLPLPKKKLDDIKSLLPFIHPNSRLFYNSLKSNDSSEDVCPIIITEISDDL